jgi:hypothetical protein
MANCLAGKYLVRLGVLSHIYHGFCLPDSAQHSQKGDEAPARQASCGHLRDARYAPSNAGWRKHMEDALVFHRINKETFLFAVFDGHGGLEVSKFCAKHLPEIIEQNKAF